MSETHTDLASIPEEGMSALDVLLGPGTPDGIAILLHMRPERVFGAEDEGEGGAKPVPSLEKTYPTSSWFFASDFLDRVAEIAASGCSGFRVRPTLVTLTFELDEKAYRHVDLILDSFDDAYRAL